MGVFEVLGVFGSANDIHWGDTLQDLVTLFPTRPHVRN